MSPLFVSNKAVLVNPQGRILILKLADGHDDLPGGRMNAGEGMLDALAREVREETGIEIDPAKARPFFAARRWYHGERMDVAGIFYVVPVGPVEVALSREHVSYEWADPRRPLALTAEIGEAVDAYRSHEGIVVAADAAIKGRQGFGLVQVFTGNGKGKTTAALGEAIRALGAGKSVGIVYFDKGGTSHYNERAVLDRLAQSNPSDSANSSNPFSNPVYVPTGRDRIDPVTGRFDFSIQDIDRAEARRGIAEARALFAAGLDLVILDEINSTADLGMVSVEDVLELIADKPDRTELVLTGRNAAQAVLDRAHLVTEMRLRTHYFYSGVQARPGLDY